MRSSRAGALWSFKVSKVTESDMVFHCLWGARDPSQDTGRKQIGRKLNVPQPMGPFSSTSPDSPLRFALTSRIIFRGI